MKHTLLILCLSLGACLVLGIAIYQVFGCHSRVQCKLAWEVSASDFSRDFAQSFFAGKHDFSNFCSRSEVRTAIESRRRDFSVNCSSGTSTARLVLFSKQSATNSRVICVDSKTLRPIYFFQDFLAPDTNDCTSARY